MSIVPVTVSTNRVAAWIIDRICEARMMRRRSKRSAIAPPIGPKKTDGKRSAKATSPSHVPDWVSSQVSHPTPMRCIQVPISDTELPAT